MIPQGFKRTLLTAKIGSDALRSKAHIAKTLGALKGLPQKIGQMLSMNDDLSSENPFMELTEHVADPLCYEDVRHIVETELQCELHLKFKFFSETPAAVASLAQVHQATTLDGDPVAVKVQYPHMQEAISSDLKNLGWLGAPFKAVQRQFKLDDYQQEFLTLLEKELDYLHEEKNILNFSKAHSLSSYLILPKVYHQLSTSKVLTLNWIAGEHFSEVSKWSLEVRHQIAVSLLDLFLKSAFESRLIHADPHPGNYRFIVAPIPKIILYDFGCLKEVSEAVAYHLHSLMSAVIKNEPIDCFQAFVAMGFDPTHLFPIKNKLWPTVQILFEPLQAPKNYDLSAWNLKDRIGSLLGADKWALRIAGPASFFTIMRAFQGLVYYLRNLKAPICWQELFFKIQSPQQPKSNPLPIKNQRGDCCEYLRVRVKQNGVNKVELYFKPELAHSLSEIIPEDILEMLPRQGIVLHTIQNKINSQALMPQEIFRLSDKNREVLVWLE